MFAYQTVSQVSIEREEGAGLGLGYRSGSSPIGIMGKDVSIWTFPAQRTVALNVWLA